MQWASITLPLILMWTGHRSFVPPPCQNWCPFTLSLDVSTNIQHSYTVACCFASSPTADIRFSRGWDTLWTLCVDSQREVSRWSLSAPRPQGCRWGFWYFVTTEALQISHKSKKTKIRTMCIQVKAIVVAILNHDHKSFVYSLPFQVWDGCFCLWSFHGFPGELPAVRQVDDWRRSLGALLRMSSQRLAVDEASWAGCTAGTPATNLQSGSFTSSIIIPAMGPPNWIGNELVVIPSYPWVYLVKSQFLDYCRDVK